MTELINGHNLSGHIVMVERPHRIEVPGATRQVWFEWGPRSRVLSFFCHGETIGRIVARDVSTPVDANAIAIVFANGWQAALRHNKLE